MASWNDNNQRKIELEDAWEINTTLYYTYIVYCKGLGTQIQGNCSYN